MKLSKEELAEVQRIQEISSMSIKPLVHVDFLLSLILRPKSRGRFTYEWVNCDVCLNGFSSAVRVKDCKECSGLGKVRVKVKSKAHNA